jgi:signal transduction histidine kinase/CheY-like chemotaxis protein/streptogramin lyase
MGIVAAFAAVIAAAAPAPPPAALHETPYFQSLGIAAGMPSSRVYKTVQDRDGFLWFGTQDGLARYDGVGFRVWRHDANDAGSLGGNVVSALFVDRDNRLWCGAEETGLSIFDAQRRRFAHFRHDANDPTSLASDDVWAIAEDASGAIWIGSFAGGLDRLERGGRVFSHRRHDAADPRSIASDNVLSLLSARDGRLWIGSDAGIDVIDGSNVRHVDVAATAGDARLNAISLLETGDGAVLAATRHGVLSIGADLTARPLADAELSDRLVYGLAGAPAADLWIATRHGLNRRGTDGTVSVYRESSAMPGAFPGDSVFDALSDREGGLWFATLDGGVARLPPSWRDFALYRNDPADASSLSSNRSRGVSVDAAGRVWAVSSDGAIDRIDPASGRIERFAGRLPAPDKSLWSVLADRAGQLWVGHTSGLRVYDLQSGHYSDLAVAAARSDALAPGLVYHLAQDPAGLVWAAAYGSGGGLHRIDPATHRIERFDADNAGLRSAEVDQIAFDRSGDLLVASGAGLDRFDRTARRFVALGVAVLQRVYAFDFAGDGTLWLHVPGALEHRRYDGHALALIERVDATAGWPSLTVGGLQVDAGGVVWVSSARGLWRYDPQWRRIRQFDLHDGLASPEFSRLPLARRSDGAIFGATLAGVVGFQPAAFAEAANPPPLVLDRVVVRRGGADLALEPAGLAELRWDDRDLRVTARALSYANAASNRYQWRLKGFDRDWIDGGTHGEREFSQLPPGDYRLQVRATAAGSDWSAPLDALHLRVAAPPWAMPLARAAYAAAALLVVFAAFRAYRARMRRRHALELAEQQRRFAEQSSAAKSEFLATMGHEIRTPMTGVLGMAELLLRTPLDSRQRGYATAIFDSGRLMLRLVNDSLDLARIEAGRLGLESAPFDLHALLHGIAAIAQPLAAQKRLEWKLTIARGAPQRVRGDAVRIEQILLNLVNNAIKFTERGVVALDACGDGDGVSFVVADSGPGIGGVLRARLFGRFEQAEGERRRGSSGLGLAICRELVAAMGGTIAVESIVGAGSTFRVRLPMEAVEGEAVARDSEVHAVPAGAAASPRRLLLVEDDATVAAVIAGLLAAQGHDVTHVAHGLAALAELDASPFDAALIDLDLPGIDGFAFARLLRAREAQRAGIRLPLIGISARSTGREEAACSDAGMAAFLRKPLSGEVLQSALANVLAGAPSGEVRVSP